MQSQTFKVVGRTQINECWLLSFGLLFSLEFYNNRSSMLQINGSQKVLWVSDEIIVSTKLQVLSDERKELKSVKFYDSKIFRPQLIFKTEVLMMKWHIIQFYLYLISILFATPCFVHWNHYFYAFLICLYSQFLASRFFSCSDDLLHFCFR